MSSSNKIKGKIVVKGQIECLAPVHIGCGRAEYSDMDIIRDSEGNVFIPAAGFVGVLRHAFHAQFHEQIERNPSLRNFWGYTGKDDGQQSALCCSDLMLIESASAEVVTRDGICIDNTKGIVKNKGKFDFELLERGSRFQLQMEFTFREHDEAFVKQTARTIYDLLASEQLQIGAKTNNGFGRIGLVEQTAQIHLFDFSHKTHVRHWLTERFADETLVSPETLRKLFYWQKKRFRIKATLLLKNSLLVRSYAGESKMPDASQLKSGTDWVIPGASLKGAIRARAERIANTILDEKKAQEIMRELFGYVIEEFKKAKSGDDQTRSATDENSNEKADLKKAVKGRIKVQEMILPSNAFKEELQTRIRVDRFTGGVIEGGLFDSMPVFAPAEDKALELLIEIENYDHRKDKDKAGLLLLVLKDLWSGDLAVGGEKNIGRGVLQGVRTEIDWGEEEKIILEGDLSSLSENEKEKLQGFVVALSRSKTDG